MTLWVNKVGPYNNPQETYNYYSLPFCRSSANSGHRWGGLGEVLGGNELIDSQIDIKFGSKYWLFMLIFLYNNYSLLPSVYGCVYALHIFYLILRNDVLLFYLAENTEKTTICELELDPTKAKQFRDAIENSYWFEFFIGMVFIHDTHYMYQLLPFINDTHIVKYHLLSLSDISVNEVMHYLCSLVKYVAFCGF